MQIEINFDNNKVAGSIPTAVVFSSQPQNDIANSTSFKGKCRLFYSDGRRFISHSQRETQNVRTI